MKLLVFAHLPPPVHGQSVMVAALLEGLAGDPELQLLHVNPQLSRDTADIGRVRPGKLFALFRACFTAWKLRAQHGRCVLYYVPAPGKWSALYRDFIVMLTCRALFSGLILHWHASGLPGWLQTRPRFERWLAHRLLGGADLSIVLGEALRESAAALSPRKIVVVRNGIPDPCPAFVRLPRVCPDVLETVFLGLCVREKGIFDALYGVADANRRLKMSGVRVRLSVAGSFPDQAERRAFESEVLASGAEVRVLGFVSGPEKHRLLAHADVLLFPTFYPHETQGLVVAEALAHDLPVITTRWRAVHEGLPETGVYLVQPNSPQQIAKALLAVNVAAPPAGALRRHYESHLSIETHLRALRSALLGVMPPQSRPEIHGVY